MLALVVLLACLPAPTHEKNRIAFSILFYPLLAYSVLELPLLAVQPNTDSARQTTKHVSS